MKSASALLIGPLPWVAVALGVLWVAGGVALLLAGSGAAGSVLAVLAVLAGLGLIVMAARMVVLVDATRLRQPGHRPLQRADIEAVGLQRLPGMLPLYVPGVDVRQGRALRRYDVDGLSGVGRRTGALRRAARLADRLGVELVEVAAPSSSRGRRRADE